ncbi:MAG: acyltransferase domain-containing protein [Rubellimicrobium sp.]|nr:acyltransferase domain-containing protein [Rubellimicrobium sp.]
MSDTTGIATDTATDIAIVGMAGIYPQADDIDIFWSNILAARDCVTEAPEGWLGVGDIYDPGSDVPGHIYTSRGGFLGDLSRFDPRRFGTMPRAMGGQPDQFLALKVAHDALVDAGYVPGRFDGERTGVILGHSLHGHRANISAIQQVWVHGQFRQVLDALFPGLPPDRVDAAMAMLKAGLPPLDPEGVPGLVPNVMTGRICNRLDLMGPNYIIDAACSSSLIAVDLAIGELRAGRAEMMLAGGVNTTTSPLVYGLFCTVNALSPDGRIRPFDRGANGTVLGEGAGVLVLKRLADALRDDNRIYAVIKGVGQSSDGKSSGLMAPRLEGEMLAVRRAYAQTGIDPATIGLIEAHGTGIPLGDRTEVEALRQVFGTREGGLPRVPIGSVKSMIGHCIPAAGSAAIIKMALALDQGIVPPTLCDEVSAEIGLERTQFHVATETRPWIQSGSHPRRAAINAFGFGGINAHMILEQSPVGRTPDPTAAFLPRDVGVVPEQEQVLVFAGADRSAVLAALETVLADREAGLAALSAASWDRAMATEGAPARLAPARLAIVAADRAEFEKKAETVRAKLPGLPPGGTLQTRSGIHYEDRARVAEGGKVGFLFPGEMAQYPGMMADVAMAYPVVRDWFDFIGSLTEGRRAVALEQVIHPPTTLVDEAGRILLEELIHRVDYGSEMVFAADQAVFALLSAMGIRADAMLGHSTGENAALVASGLIDLDRDRVGRMIAEMNTVFSRVEQSGQVPRGVLLNVAVLPRAELEALLARHPDLHFTMDNCPNQAILFGQKTAIDALAREAVAAGAVCTHLPISWGYHTEHVKPLAEEFERLFDGLKLARGAGVTLYSCGTAKPFPKTPAGFRKTAIAQYTARVRFTEAVERMHADGVRVFVECGPNAVLSAFVRDILGDRPHLAVSADNRRRGMEEQLRHLVAQLFAAGVPMDPRDFLLPAEAAATLRRREMRVAQRKAPVLPGELGVFRIGAEEAQTLRDLLIVPAEAPAQAQVAPFATPASPAPPPAASPGPDPAAGLQAHLSLMNRFLQGTGHVMTRALVAGAQGPGRIGVLDIGRGFAPPFAFRAYLMEGASPSLEAIRPHLAPAELPEAEALAAKGGPRWQEWCLSRLAVKRAVGAVLGPVQGQHLPGAGIEIRKAPGGAPYVALADAAVARPAISLSHAGAAGVGAAAGPGWRMGIDYETPARIRDAAEFLHTIASDAEQATLGLPATAEGAALVWSVKEATAKALGLGLQGRPQQFAVVGADLGKGIVRLQHDRYTVEAQVRRVRDAVCAVAWLPAEAAPPAV